jgi:hypothetical protein
LIARSLVAFHLPLIAALVAMGYRHKSRLFGTGALVLVLAASSASAEELVLKDGRKLVGTIVGYEDDMFRVETEFGFALVRKDKVASVNFAPTVSSDAPQKQSDTKGRSTSSSSTKSAAPKPGKAAESPAAKPTPNTDATSGPPKTQESPSSGREFAPASVAPNPPPAHVDIAVAPPSPVPAPSVPRAVAPPPPPPVSKPLDEPLPPHIQDHVEGNSYINDTFQFAMYKPPGWKVYEGVPHETGSAIVAVGAEDERTLLFVDRQAWSGPPDLGSDGTEARLRQTYQDYKKLSESTLQVNGQPAIRRVFTGLLDGIEWYGVSVHFTHGKAVFGITGLTSAETAQFQEALFMKIINSFKFLSLQSNSRSLAPVSVMSVRASFDLMEDSVLKYSSP